MSNEQLVIMIKAGEDVNENMLQLYQQAENYIYSIVKRYRAFEDTDDLMQEGFLALYDAVDGYDPDAGNKFLTYASWHIRQRMQRYIVDKGSCLRIPAGKIEKLQRYKKFCNRFMVECGHQPTDQEAVGHLGWTADQVMDIKMLAITSEVGSLDCPLTGTDGGEGGTIGDLIAGPELTEGEVIDRMQQEQARAALWSTVESLQDTQAQTIKHRFGQNMTLGDVGRLMGIGVAAVEQNQRSALRALRGKPSIRRIAEEMGVIDQFAYRGGVAAFKRTWTSATESAVFRLMELDGQEV